MTKHVCEKCGAEASIQVATSRARRSGAPAPVESPTHRYCRLCAISEGIRLPPSRPERSAEALEYQELSWSTIGNLLEQCDSSWGHSPEIDQSIRELLPTIVDFTVRLPEPTPPEVAAAIDRLTRKTS